MAESAESAETENRLDFLRGRTMPQRHTARTISALATNPGCARRALLDASGADKGLVAARAGHPGPFGQSEFAMARGNAFEARVKAEGAARIRTLLRDHLHLDLKAAHFEDLGDVGGNESLELRHKRTRRLLAAVSDNSNNDSGTLFDHPLLRLEIGGRGAYLEPDLVAYQHPSPRQPSSRQPSPQEPGSREPGSREPGQFHVVEIKSFPVIDGQAEADKVAAAAIQSAVYVLALRELLGDPDDKHKLVSHVAILICPENFASNPVAVTLDVRKQLIVLRRQLSRMARIDDLLELYPEDLTFDLDPDPKTGASRRQPDELKKAVLAVGANYTPDCLSTCDLCYLCRDEAGGTTTALGRQVREDFGGVEHVRTALDLARGKTSPRDTQEAAEQLARAAKLRADIMGTEPPGEGS
jgi:hypothetical protein